MTDIVIRTVIIINIKSRLTILNARVTFVLYEPIFIPLEECFNIDCIDYVCRLMIGPYTKLLYIVLT